MEIRDGRMRRLEMGKCGEERRETMRKIRDGGMRRLEMGEYGQD